MGVVYDNWERLVDATLRREELRRIALRTPSNVSSVSASPSFNASVLEGASGGEETRTEGETSACNDLRIFSFSELKLATNNFAHRTQLGCNELGMLHRGSLCDKASSICTNESLIAVRRFHSESVQEFHEWQSEVNLIGRLSHPNIIKLLGYCREDNELLLVYEYLQQGSLEKLLFERDYTNHPLPWDRRLKILIEAARGLAFLHASERQGLFNQKEEREGFYEYFDTSDILLDHSYNAKISGFSLATISEDPPQPDVEVYPGTGWPRCSSHSAPEYVMTGNLYLEGDVYGFGIVMVEMLTGLRVGYWALRPGQCVQVDRIKHDLATRRRLDKIMDSRLEGKYPAKAAKKVSELALRCLEMQPKRRPSMQEVAEVLELIDSADRN
ncbi:unnamed protein product [Coffea canephora]|uniref:Protein kinase domain-containing protein n=2 Tax=Coffea TaxID=13442 RepID=A0A068TYW1_COFCA|nr:probable serine/threonine-protein kinase PIX13 [Coffea arabica]CDP01495.1 unnamed protein product [Coffea canephora]